MSDGQVVSVIRRATGDLIAFTDDDCVPAPAAKATRRAAEAPR